MARGMETYIAECFYGDMQSVGGVQKDSFHLRALTDEGAIEEAKIHAPFKRRDAKLRYFRVRRLVGKTGKIIYTSPEE
jgi:hypothetical protein